MFGEGGEAERRGSGDAVRCIEPESSRPVHSMLSPGAGAATTAPARAAPRPRASRTSRASHDDDEDSAVKKFGSAKAISSEQFFGEQESRSERESAQSRFQGSSSISSAEFFGARGQAHGPRPGANAGFGVSAPDLDDVRESVRAGVTRVAGRLSSLANGVVSSIQERYGY